MALLFQLLTRENAKGNLRTTGTAKDSGTACSWLDRKRYLSKSDLILSNENFIGSHSMSHTLY